MLKIDVLEMKRINAIHLREEDLEDVSTFFNMEIKDCKKRIQNYQQEELTKAWERYNPRTEDEILNFYAHTDLLIWELLQWNASEERKEIEDLKRQILTCFPPNRYPKVLDYGGGIGTDSIFFAQRGYRVTFAETKGLTFSFAEHRFKRRNLTIELLPITSSLPSVKDKFHIILCFDVLEHLLYPVKILQFLCKHLYSKGIIAITGPPHITYKGRPHHLISNYPLLSGEYWNLTLDRVGLRRKDKYLYSKSDPVTKALRRCRYLLWKSTGFYVFRLSSNPPEKIRCLK